MTDLIRTLVLTGQSSVYHDWRASSRVLAGRLREAARFAVTVVDGSPVTSGAIEVPGVGWDVGDLGAIDVVVLDYEGARWPRAVEDALLRFVDGGGGLVVVHASDNAFPDWEEFQRLCGVGGWGGRDESSGPKVRWRDGRQVLDRSPGVATHPAIHEFVVTTRAPDHPITRGLPPAWRHARDELYSQLRGPADGLQVLATGWADPSLEKATGEHEPVMMAIEYGAGRVFHTTLGHVGPDDGHTVALDCVGFITTFVRGVEWAATGTADPSVPPDFPTATSVSLRPRTTSPPGA